MKLTIDNLDGLGAVDYSATIDRATPFEIVRTLNAPSLARGRLCLGDVGLAGSSLATPARRGRVVITSSAGLALFTGYLATEPVSLYAGCRQPGAGLSARLHRHQR